MPNKRSTLGCFNGASNIILSFQILISYILFKNTLIYTVYIFLPIVNKHFNKGRKAFCIFQSQHLTCTNHISIVFGLISIYLLKRCQPLSGTDFSCDGFITLPPLTLTSFKAMNVILKCARFLKFGILALYQERTVLIVSKFQYSQCIGSRTVKLKQLSTCIHVSHLVVYLFRFI